MAHALEIEPTGDGSGLENYPLSTIIPEPEDYYLLGELSPELLDHTVSIQATVDSVRIHSKVSFVTLHGDRPDASLQVVFETPDRESKSTFASLGLKTGQAVRVNGMFSERPPNAVREKDIDHNPLASFELRSATDQISVIATPERLPENFTWADLRAGKALTAENYGEVLRMPEFKRVLLLRHGLKQAYFNHFATRGFIPIDVPGLTGSISESGAEVFRVQARTGELALIQSPQQIKQVMAELLGRVVWIGQAFRNDPSDTSHHLVEFTGVDMEMQIRREDKMEGMLDVMWELQEAVRAMLHEMANHGQVFQDNSATIPVMLDGGVPMISYKQALEIAGTESFDREAEKRNAEVIKAQTGSDFYFVVGFPSAIKPFYTDLLEVEPETTYSFDLIMDGVEITSGGLRINDPALLRTRLHDKGYDPANFIAYLDHFDRGAAQTGGFGLGLERLVAQALGLNVKLTTPFPKTAHLVLG